MVGPRAPSGTLQSHYDGMSSVLNSSKPKPKIQNDDPAGSDDSNSSDSSSSDSDSDAESNDDFMARLTAKYSAPAASATPIANGVGQSERKKPVGKTGANVKQEESDAEGRSVLANGKAKKKSKKSKTNSTSGSYSDSESEPASKSAKKSVLKDESSDEETSSSGSDSDSDSGKKRKANGVKPKPNGKALRDDSESDSSTSEEDSKKKKKKRAQKNEPASAKANGKSKRKATPSSPTSSSESSSEDENPTTKSANRKNSKAPTSPSSSSSEAESSSSEEEDEKAEASAQSDEEDEEDSDVEMEDSKAIVPAVNGRQPAGAFANPEINRQGFYLRRMDDLGDASDVTKLFKNSKLKGKQIWVVAVPDDIPVSMIENMDFNSAGSSSPALTQNGENYALSSQGSGTMRTLQFGFPSNQGPGFLSDSTFRPAQNLQVVRTEHFGAPAIAASIQKRIDAPKQARAQPPKLIQRYKPIGADISSKAKPAPAKGKNAAIAAQTEAILSIEPNETASKSKKRKSSADETASSKKARKSSVQETVDLIRHETPILPPQRPGVKQTIETADVAVETPVKTKSKKLKAVTADTPQPSAKKGSASTSKPKYSPPPSGGSAPQLFSSLPAKTEDTPKKEKSSSKKEKSSKKDKSAALPSSLRKETPIPPPRYGLL